MKSIKTFGLISHNEHIPLWEKINQLFLDHYPVFEEKEMASSLSPMYPRGGKVFSTERGDIPVGYQNFLVTHETVSRILDSMINFNREIFGKFPNNFFGHDIFIYDKAIELIDFIPELSRLINSSEEDLFSDYIGGAVKSRTFRFKCGNWKGAVDIHWKDWLSLDILESIEKWMNKIGIDISELTGACFEYYYMVGKKKENLSNNSEDANCKAKKPVRKLATQEEIKEILTDMKNQIKKKCTLKKYNKAANFVGEIIPTLQWPNDTTHVCNTACAEFIYRLSLILDIQLSKKDDNHHDIINYLNDPTDNNGMREKIQDVIEGLFRTFQNNKND